MSATRHTPGPWRYSRDLCGGAVQLPSVSIYAGQPFGYLVCEVIPNPSGELHANTALIAAAPELLAVLKDAKEELAVALAWSGNENMRSRINVAILRAEGTP